MNPLVSVIIPTYNVEKYIEKAIQSVLDQTYPNIEIIVVDDGSTDQTVDLVRSFHDERIKLLVNEQNMGPSHSRNRGIKKAKGEWIALLDGDDWWEKNRISKMIHVAKDLSADIIADDHIYVYETKNDQFKVVTTFLKKRDLKGMNRFISIKEFIEYNIEAQPIIRKTIFDEGLLYREKYRYAEDFDLYLRILLKGYRWFQLNEGYYYYRQRETSSVRQVIPLNEQAIKQINDILSTQQLDSELIEILNKRKKERVENLRYYKIITYLKKKSYKQAIVNLMKDPLSILIILKRIPKVIVGRFVLFKLMRS